MSLGLRIVAATGLDQGDRPYQQDQLGLMAHPRDRGCVLGVVADGMGGRTGGRKASDQVLMTAKQLFERYHSDGDSAPELLRRIGLESHTVIRLIAVSAEQEPHSTMAAFLLNPDGTCHCAHSGDSRLYHFRGNSLQFRTKDHSYVQALVDRGELDEKLAQTDPRSNVLLSCLGTDKPPQISLHSIEHLQAGDSLLLCSDGLWHYFREHELAMVVSQVSPREACQFLIEKARTRAAGRGDNISAIVLKLEALGS
jgi:PPM family protein phosphatase